MSVIARMTTVTQDPLETITGVVIMSEVVEIIDRGRILANTMTANMVDIQEGIGDGEEMALNTHVKPKDTVMSLRG